MVESVIATTPSGRSAEPEEVAALVVFLLTDVCAAMTGQIMAVDRSRSVPLAALSVPAKRPVLKRAKV